jgi:hypothetical protein
MKVSLYLSAFAILISLISLVWSIHIGRRDRGRIKATSKLLKSVSRSLYLEVRAVNHGRRPVILTMLITDFANGSSFGSYLIPEEKCRLEEGEFFEQAIKAGDNYTISHEGVEAINFWFEDTLGNRYKVKNAKKHLKVLLGQKVKRRRWLPIKVRMAREK